MSEARWPVIRSANSADAEIIFQFIVELATYERAPDAVETTPQILRQQLALTRPPFECLLAFDDSGEPVGFALFFETYSTWKGRPGLHLEDLYVTESARGQGFGLALLKAVQAIADARDYPRLEWAVLDWNEPAIEFYRAYGAQPLDDWTTWRLCLDGLSADDNG
ncbi:MAG: GNAT family N-acetyltransferase [Myxococcota bacterium]|nr:GNAT family N-acetyltransferase [Myxococcota bacterium]